MDGHKLKAKATPRSPLTNEQSLKSSPKHPSPIDLDRFVPWIFMELQATQMVIVRKQYQEDYPRKLGRKSMSRISLSKKASSRLNLSQKVDSHTTADPTEPLTFSEENTIQLITYYNRAGHLVEIAINDCPFPINHKFIETISLCLPFHKMLEKLTLTGKGLNCSVIHEISKMLPLSHLTDICLDNTFVPQGNYYILLDQASTLNYLSLSKCRINDIVCAKIADRLEFGGPASKNLLILSLSCNFITDVGAEALGHSLRTNRHLLHLNLSGNSITSIGAGQLLEPLSEFLLTVDEVREKIRRRWDYYKGKILVESRPESSDETSIDLRNSTEYYYKMTGSLNISSQIDSTDTCVATDLDEKMPEEYVFGPSNTVFKNGCWYTAGNLVLCSLNLGYNNLDYTSLPKIVEMLSYQKDQERSKSCTGLLRIVIEGNYLPVNCEEYDKIGTYIDILRNNVMSFKKKRESSTTASYWKQRRSTVRLMTPRDTIGVRKSSPRAVSPLSIK